MSRLVSLLVLAAFVPLIGRDLPATVASHFGPDGLANGFMPRASYLTLMAALTVGLPGLLMLAGATLGRLPAGLVNVPHKHYYLAPERREATLDYLSDVLGLLGWTTAGFLVVVHWAVCQANKLSPPRLPPEWFLPALGVFLALVFLQVFRLFRRFPRPPG